MSHTCVIWHTNESCHTQMSHVTYKRVMSHMSHTNESCHIWTSHVTYERAPHEWVTWHDSLTHSCGARDSFVSRDADTWDMTHLCVTCVTWLICTWHDSFVCDMTHLYCACITRDEITRDAGAKHQTQCVAVCWNMMQCVGICCSMLQCGAMCCSVLQCVAVCCNALQRVAVLPSEKCDRKAMDRPPKRNSNMICKSTTKRNLLFSIKNIDPQKTSVPFCSSLLFVLMD